MMGTTTKVSYQNDEFVFCMSGKSYSIAVYAEANYWYSPGCMYLRNGDPGEPPEEELEITKVDIGDIVCEDDDDRLVTDSDELDMAREAIDDELYALDYERWSA